MYELRKYQEDGVEAGINFINSKMDNKKGIIVAPTGSGKSLYIAGIANRLSTPLIILQPTKELLQQNHEKYISYGNIASIYSASLKSKEIGHVTFATIGSIKNEALRFKDLGVKVIIMDECHIGGASTGILNKFLKQLGKVKIIGLTATPIVLMNGMEGPMLKMLNRTRKSFYNHILHITQVRDIIKQGFWSPLVYEQIKIKQDKLEYNASRSEFSEESQRKVYEENSIEDKIIKKIQELRYARKSILVFVPSVDEAKNLSSKIKDSFAVWGNMPSKDRDAIIRDFKAGLIKVVINVNVLAIGFDFPALDTIIDATPTASFGRYYQKLGRVCRPHLSKENSLIIDISGNYSRFGELADLTFEDYPRIGWGMFVRDQLLTGVSLDNSAPVYKTPLEDLKEEVVLFNFGKYNGKAVKDAPKSYLSWIMSEFTFSSRTNHIKKEIEKLQKERQYAN